MVEQDEQARILRHIMAAGVGGAFNIPEIGGNTIPVATAQAADDGKALDLIAHSRLETHVAL